MLKIKFPSESNYLKYILGGKTTSIRVGRQNFLLDGMPNTIFQLSYGKIIYILFPSNSYLNLVFSFHKNKSIFIKFQIMYKISY